jgi:hypothetical protein
LAISSENTQCVTAFRHQAVADRQVDELIGIIKGVLADNVVTQDEVEFLLAWMEANRKVAMLWPAKVLYPRLAAALSGGAMQSSDAAEILSLLRNTIGSAIIPDRNEPSAQTSTRLPLSSDSPVTFQGKYFCFTGTFQSGTRSWCQAQIEQRGGICLNGITKKLNYLVVGVTGNENWLHSTHGRKIEKAIAYQESGCELAILSEEHWYSQLQNGVSVIDTPEIFTAPVIVNEASIANDIIPIITGTGKFGIEVAGVFTHQEQIARSVISYGEEVANNGLPALLRRHPDGAISVEMSGNITGYLSKYIARDFHAALIAGDLNEYAVFECCARILKHNGLYQIWLDLPEDE